MRIFRHLDQLDARKLTHEDQIFIAQFKRYTMNDPSIPDYLKVDDLETLTSRDMESAGYTRNKFRFADKSATWGRKSRECTVVDNQECREKVREVFVSDAYTVFSDRTGLSNLHSPLNSRGPITPN